MATTLFNLDDLKPKFQDQTDRYNNWYFTVHFEHEGEKYLVKLAITEGTLLGQFTFLACSHDPLSLKEEGDVTVLLPSAGGINIIHPEERVSFDIQGDQVRVDMGELTAICTAEQRRIISRHAQIGADLTFTPRGPVFNWGHVPGALCPVTEATRVSGSESLSNVHGTVTINGKTMPVDGRGLFERVWIGQLSFFEIRATDWLYAHFDEMYVYFCRTESADSQGRPFHFETGEAFLILNNDFMHVTGLDISPERWVFLQEARRFIPIEQTFEVRTDQGKLTLHTCVSNYPQFIQPPVRLEFLTIDNVSGWGTVFYDSPVQVEGEFKYKDGRVVKLTNGVGINEQIRISPL